MMRGHPVTLSPEDKQFYLDNGYFIAKGLFEPAECDEIMERLNLYKNKKGAAMMNMDREYELSRYAEEKIAEDRGIPIPKDRSAPIYGVSLKDIPFQQNIETCRLLRAFMRDPRQVSLLEQLHAGEYETRTGKSPLVWGGLMTQIIFKEPETQYGNQAWNPHQDNSYVLNPNGVYVTTNTFFADADVENGTMYAYPGTHKEGILPCEEVPSFREAAGKNPGNKAVIPEKYLDKKVDLFFKKGDVLFLNGDLVHGSYPNLSGNSPTPRPRPLYMNVYIPEGEYFRPGIGSRKMFLPLN